jgi:hypothetical protein
VQREGKALEGSWTARAATGPRLAAPMPLLERKGGEHCTRAGDEGGET